jgi:hypothetical protein
MWYILISAVWGLHDIGYFHTGMFEKNRDPGLYEVSLGIEGQDLILSAFGYFNNDK